MFSRSIRLLKQSIAAGSLLVASLSASAGIMTFSGDLTGQPTYHRVLSTGSSLSGVGTAVRYQVFNFTVDTSSMYSIETTSTSFNLVSPSALPNDTFISVYTGFTPANALLNHLKSDDDSGAGALSLISNLTLNAGTDYQLVVTSFDNGVQGAFAGEIRSEFGTARLSQGEVPVPASLALVGLGLVGLTFKRSRKLEQVA